MRLPTRSTQVQWYSGDRQACWPLVLSSISCAVSVYWLRMTENGWQIYFYCLYSLSIAKTKLRELLYLFLKNFRCFSYSGITNNSKEKNSIKTEYLSFVFKFESCSQYWIFQKFYITYLVVCWDLVNLFV